MYKIRTDGKGYAQLNEDESWFIYVRGDWIYYSNRNDRGKLYKIRRDGSERSQLNEDESWFIHNADHE